MKKILIILLLALSFCKTEAQYIVPAQIGFNHVLTAASGCTPDADTQAFIDSAGITDSLQKVAICELVKDLKDSSLWTTMNAIYPFIGGAESTHKWNLKDPRNLDAAFRLSFVGTWTHDANGAMPSITYANTFLNPSTVLSASSWHLSVYSRTDDQLGVSDDIGAVDGTKYMTLSAGRNSGDILFTEAGGSYTYAAASSYSQAGFFEGTKTSGDFDDLFLYRNGTGLGVNAADGGSSLLPNYPLLIGAENVNGAASNFTNRQYAFISIGAEHTSAQAATLNTIVEKYQDKLSRGVQ